MFQMYHYHVHVSKKNPNLSNLFLILTFIFIIGRILGIVCPPETGAEAKVCEFDMTTSINEDIVWLDVTVDEAHVVNRLDSRSQLSNVKPANENI